MQFKIHFISCSFCGITSSARVVAVLMVEMALKKHPFNFNFGNRKKSYRPKSGEYGGCFSITYSKVRFFEVMLKTNRKRFLSTYSVENLKVGKQRH